MALVAIGALITNIPIVTLINWYGPRYLFTAVGFFGAAATALIPYCMKMGWNWFLLARALQGMAFAGDMATFGHFVTYWTYHKQYAFFTATLFFNSIAFCSMASILVIASFVPPGHGNLALFLLTASAFSLGFNIGGFYKSGSMIAGPYSPFVMGQISTAMTVTM
uniref:Major facilitator superfamily (MFS) profile domain-containing protein n=1 Tax=Meloidogyne javanica TaxID=6303 RepID=A0A915MQ98_MELJA